MPRSMWKGAISFGLVNIPVKLYGATQSKDISFHLLHKDCHSRLKNVRWCPVHNKAVEWDEIVRGYEFAKDQYAVVSDEELEKLPVPSKHTVDVCSVVDADEIDPLYYEKSYYLEPDTSGTKGYALLASSLDNKGLVALAKITLRTKQRLCAIRISEGVMLLETLYGGDEVHLPRPVDVPRAKVTDRELAMAENLLDELREPFEPDKYPDEYREAVTALLEEKSQPKRKVTSPQAEGSNVIDLMSALKQSLAAAKKGNKGDAPKSAAKKSQGSKAPATKAPRRKAS
jgi:DNA end-binding protein Ku